MRSTSTRPPEPVERPAVCLVHDDVRRLVQLPASGAPARSSSTPSCVPSDDERLVAGRFTKMVQPAAVRPVKSARDPTRYRSSAARQMPRRNALTSSYGTTSLFDVQVDAEARSTAADVPGRSVQELEAQVLHALPTSSPPCSPVLLVGTRTRTHPCHRCGWTARTSSPSIRRVVRPCTHPSSDAVPQPDDTPLSSTSFGPLRRAPPRSCPAPSRARRIPLVPSSCVLPSVAFPLTRRSRSRIRLDPPICTPSV